MYLKEPLKFLIIKLLFHIALGASFGQWSSADCKSQVNYSNEWRFRTQYVLFCHLMSMLLQMLCFSTIFFLYIFFLLLQVTYHLLWFQQLPWVLWVMVTCGGRYGTAWIIAVFVNCC
jgi:hypothetical protein